MKKAIDLKILDPDSICIEDIAHALSHIPRFAGHLPQLYSVAQHSYYVSQMVSGKRRLGALLHDASEAYIGDMPSPFKKMMPEYKIIEEKLMKVIALKFGIEYPFHLEIKEADANMLNAEWDSFVNKSRILPYWNPQHAKQMFLNEFKLLSNHYKNEPRT